MTSQKVHQACILVGGKGTRLGDLTRNIPKPLIDIGSGRVFLDFVIEQLDRQGFDDIVLLAGHLGHLVRDRYDGRGFGSARIRAIVEPAPLGTAGALAGMRDIADPQFLLLNGDTFFDIDLRALCESAVAAHYDALIALRGVDDGSRYGSVVLDGDRVMRFVEKGQAPGRALINAGRYLLRSSVIDRISALPCSIETDIFPILATERRLGGKVCNGYFIDIGLPDTLRQAQDELMLHVHIMRNASPMK